MLIVATAPVPHALTVAVCNSLSIDVVSRLPPNHGPIRAVRGCSDRVASLCTNVHRRVHLKHRICVICPLVARDRGDSLGGLRRNCTTLYSVFPRFGVDGIRNGVGSGRGSTRVRGFMSNRARVLITAAIVRINIGIPGTSIVIVLSSRHFKLSRLRRLHKHMKHNTSRDCYVLIAACGLSTRADGHVSVVYRAGSKFHVTRTSLGLHKPNSLRNARRDNVTFSLGVTSVTHSKRVVAVTHRRTRGVVSTSPAYASSRCTVL